MNREVQGGIHHYLLRLPETSKKDAGLLNKIVEMHP